MRVLVCGGRKYSNKDKVEEVLNYINHQTPFDRIIQGGASGADQLGKEYGNSNEIPVDTYPAKWRDLEVEGAVIKKGKYGPYNAVAGHQRNQLMLDRGKPDLVIAFKGGTGTADMIKRSKEANIEVMEIEE